MKIIGRIQRGAASVVTGLCLIVLLALFVLRLLEE